MAKAETGTRLRLLQLLEQHGPTYGLRLARLGEIPKGTVYVTLGRLKDEGLVASDRMRHPVPYELTPLGRAVVGASEAAEAAFAEALG